MRARSSSSEIRRGSVSRLIALPNGLEADKATATFEHGILTLRIPKAEAVKPRQIRITPTVEGHATNGSDRRPPTGRARTADGDNGTAPDPMASIRPERDPERPVYVISVAATLVSAHPRTLRIYEDEGLLCPARTPTEHPPLQRERHPPDHLDPAPDPGARREPRRHPASCSSSRSASALGSSKPSTPKGPTDGATDAAAPAPATRTQHT